MLDIPQDLHAITDGEAEALCASLRKRLVEVASAHGGHLASNLGVVELTVALHRVFEPHRDRIVFDVGHQCYCHKMLTGRDGAMDTLRTFGGLSGFPKPLESDTDSFIVGHASTSVSAAVGMARARTILGEDYHVIALLGDGALTGGLAYEGLSDAGDSAEPLIVILNDNGMSINHSVGGVSEHLARQRLKPTYLSFKRGYQRVMNRLPLGKKLYKGIHLVKTAVKETLLPCSLFEDMGFTYLGPVDGHNVRRLTQLLQYAKDLDGPILIHVRTVKGKGFLPAEREPDRFHGVGKFDPVTGAFPPSGGKNFSTAFGEALQDLGAKEKRLCAVTAAMMPGTGLEGYAQAYPERFFDVGIAEGHAVTMCAGMAKQGVIPVFAVYSTFLQRSYDMLVHDVALQKLHVVLTVDRAGLVGEDGETHHGIFDVAFLDTVPGMKVLCPSNYAELSNMLCYAVEVMDGPVAIRYPRGVEGVYTADSGRVPALVLRPGKDVTLVGYGITINALLSAAEKLEQKGISAEVVKLNRISPLDASVVLDSVRRTGALLVAEEVSARNCVGDRICAELLKNQVQARYIALQNLGKDFPTQGPVETLRKLYGLDAGSIADKVAEELSHGKEKA